MDQESKLHDINFSGQRTVIVAGDGTVILGNASLDEPDADAWAVAAVRQMRLLDFIADHNVVVAQGHWVEEGGERKITLKTDVSVLVHVRFDSDIFHHTPPEPGEYRTDFL